MRDDQNIDGRSNEKEEEYGMKKSVKKKRLFIFFICCLYVRFFRFFVLFSISRYSVFIILEPFSRLLGTNKSQFNYTTIPVCINFKKTARCLWFSLYMAARYFFDTGIGDTCLNGSEDLSGYLNQTKFLAKCTYWHSTPN